MMLISQAVGARSWHVWVQEAELPWRPALLWGLNPPCVSQSQSCLCRIPGLGSAVPSQLNYCLLRNTCAPFTAFFCYFKAPELPEECQSHFPVLISTLAIRCARSPCISMAPRDCSHADLRVILVGVRLFPQEPEV